MQYIWHYCSNCEMYWRQHYVNKDFPIWKQKAVPIKVGSFKRICLDCKKLLVGVEDGA